ncbi:MAG: START-like domain-containing protein [Prolixibacteraceae bacterium]|nr:START-like domain-containing protein [Prolixibacteraceae bacterium]
MAEKVKVQLEYVINCSPKVLYNRLSTASGLAEWFAEDVRVKGKKFTFSWEGSEQVAEMTMKRENRIVRFNWVEDENSYFEFRISQDELTGDVSLIVIDLADADEQEEIIDLWNAQISDLKHVLGS